MKGTEGENKDNSKLMWRTDPNEHIECPFETVIAKSEVFISPLADLSSRGPYCDRLGLVCTLQICDKNLAAEFWSV